MWTLNFFNPEKGQYIANILSNIFAISDTLYCPLYLQYKVSYIANILDVDFEFFSTLKRDNILQIYCCNIRYFILSAIFAMHKVSYIANILDVDFEFFQP